MISEPYGKQALVTIEDLDLIADLLEAGQDEAIYEFVDELKERTSICYIHSPRGTCVTYAWPDELEKLIAKE